MGRGRNGANRRGRIVAAQRRNTGNLAAGFGLPTTVVSQAGRRVQPTLEEQNRARIEAQFPQRRPVPTVTPTRREMPSVSGYRNETRPDGTQIDETPTDVSYSYTVNGNYAKLSIYKPYGGYPGSVGFKVNGAYTTNSNLDPATGQSIMLRAIRSWRDHVKTAPEGAIYRVTAARGDRRVVRGQLVNGGTERAKFYQSMGFSAPQGYDGIQSTIKRDGKMVPYTGGY